MKCLDLFNSTELFNILKKDEKELFLENSTFVTYKKGDCVVKEGEFVTNSIFICSGYVKIHLDFKRRSLIINLIGPKRFASLSQIIGSDIQPFSITSLDEIFVCLTDVKIIRDIAQKNTMLAMHLLQYANKGVLDYIKNNLISLTQNNIHGRLANILIYLSESVFQSTSFDMILSRKELSQFCNISRENVIKVLYEFDTDGIIHINGKLIQINSIENLRRIANHG